MSTTRTMPCWKKIPLLGEYCVATEACRNRYLLLCSPSLSPHMMDSAIQWPWKALMVVQILMHWIVFHDPVDRVIQLLNNQGLGSNRTELTVCHMYTGAMKTIKLYSGQNPLNGHRLIQTPYYYGKLALSLGKKVLIRWFYLNSTRTPR